MKSFFCFALAFVCAASTIVFAALYYKELDSQSQARLFAGGGNTQWMRSGANHIFNVTDRTFDVGGLFGYAEGMARWAPLGGPKSPVYPNFVPASRTETIADSEYVVGVVSGATATAYPLRVLVAHQVVNDGTQSPPVMVYYGGVSHTAAAYTAAFGGRTLSFSCTGYLYGNVDLLYAFGDEDCFVPLQGAFATGEHIGERLPLLPSAVMPLGEWRKLYPDTRLMTEFTGIHQQKYPRQDVLAQPVSLKIRARQSSSQYPDGAPVIVLRDGWDSLAVPLSAAKAAGRKDLPLDFHGRSVTVHFVDDWKAAYVTDAAGALMPSERTVWQVYCGLYPDGSAANIR